MELAKITLEQREREIKLLLDDIRSLTGNGDNGTDHCHSSEKGDCLWMINNRKASLVKTTSFLEQWNSSTCRIIQIKCLINIVLLPGGRTEKGFRKPTEVSNICIISIEESTFKCFTITFGERKEQNHFLCHANFYEN